MLTRPVTRNQLAGFLPSHELVKLFENLIADVSGGLPSTLSEIEMTAENARALATLAQGLAGVALQLANQANEGPPPVPQALPGLIFDGPPPAPVVPLDAIHDGPPPAPLVLPDVDDPNARISELHDRIAILERAVAELREGPLP